VQGAASHVGSRRADLRDVENGIIGTLPAFTTADFSLGAESGSYRVELYVNNLFDSNGRYSTSLQCQAVVCGDPDGVTSTGPVFYDNVIRPRTIGLKVGYDF
jgi:iron complex outermembrane receptor protein